MGKFKVEKTASNSYRFRKTIEGKTYRITFDHEPTDLEIMKALSKEMDEIIQDCDIPFEVASMEYAKLKQNIISPTTYREYMNTPKRLSNAFNSRLISKITQLDIQQEINRLSGELAPKTVRNYHSFIVSVIHMYRPDMHITTTLPQKRAADVYIPTDEEVKQLFEYAQKHCNGRYYIPIVLGCYGLRRSEICALTPEDIKDGIININKAMVQNINKEWIIKDYTKNETSTRKVPVPESIVNMINEQGYIYEGHPNDITCFINDFCKANKIKNFSLHKLRHYFCSRLASENIDTETIIALSGHKTDYVMRNVYRHKINSKVQEASAKLTNIIGV